MSTERRRDDPDAKWNQERPAKSRAKKPLLKLYCRGNVNTPHQYELTKQQWATNRPCRRATEQEQQWWRGKRGPWLCWHQEQCSSCGKITRHFIGWAECPDLPEELKP